MNADGEPTEKFSATLLPPAIVIGVDSPKGLAVLRELGSHGVPIIGVGHTKNAIGRSSRFIKRFVIRPSDERLEIFLPRLISETGAKATLAVNEEELLELSDLPAVIDGCRVLTPRRSALDIVLDKTRTLAAARKVDIAGPQTWQPEPDQDFDARALALDYPVALKWSNPPAVHAQLCAAGLELAKVSYAERSDQLVSYLKRFDAIGVYPLVQTWCAGYGLGQMLMMVNGHAQLRFQHRRLREWPVSGGISSLAAAVPLHCHHDQMNRSEALLAAIGWQGPAMVEYRYNPADGRYRLMEVNGRFWGSISLASYCGAEFAWEQYRFFVLDATRPQRVRFKNRRARHTIPDTKHLIHVLLSKKNNANPWQAQPSRWRTLAGYFLEFFNPFTRYYVASLSDPGPAIRDVVSLFSGRIVRLREQVYNAISRNLGHY